MRTENDFSFKGEIVSFAATDGAMLYAMRCRPKRKSRTAIINLHGLQGAFYKGFLSAETGKEFVNRGFTFMSIQQRGSYKTFKLNTYKGGKWGLMTAGGDIEVFEDCVKDIEGAIKYLVKTGIKRIYLQGHSSGCQKAAYYVYKRMDRRVKGIILLGPCDDYNMWKKGNPYNAWGRSKKTGFSEAVSFAKAKARTNPRFPMDTKYDKIRMSAKRFLSVADLKNVEARLLNYDSKMAEFGRIRIPILVAFGSNDEYLVKPARKCLEILGRNTGSSDFMGVLFKGTNHAFRNKEKKLGRFAADWIEAKEKSG
jgi:alpha-beta hydrolase superfamily lysophospholipase